MVQPDQSICLCMIVKNEAAVIRRCIDSVRPLITHWLIVDTGSTDNTQGIIRDYLCDLPGTLHERPWQDFAHNRSEALTLARPLAHYSLIIDADDTLEFPEGYRLPRLEADCYMMEIRDQPMLYWRKQLVNNRLRWFYRGVLHEFVTSVEAHTSAILPIGMRRNHDGARRKDPSWFNKDVAVLEKALHAEQDPFLKTRYTFYLAQSYRDSRNPAKALQYYTQRAKMDGWQEEVFVSLYQAAKLKEESGHPAQEIIRTYEAATNANPARVEARHGAARYCRLQGLNEQGYQIAKAGLGRQLPVDSLFAETWIYDFGLADEFAVNAYWAGHHDEALNENLRLLCDNKLPEADRPRVTLNAQVAWDKLSKAYEPPNLGSVGNEPFLSQHALTAPRKLFSRLKKRPKVLVSILAKQKEAMLPLYLRCIEALDYPKSAIVLYIRTNNNTDGTEQILRDWLERVGGHYAAVEFDTTGVAAPVQNYDVHEWNPIRFAVLADIRMSSLRKTIEHRCDFYFVADVDNFIRAETLRELVSLNLPIVSPFLRSLAKERYYSNYHAEIDANGYYADSNQYFWILNRYVRGLIEVPVVHCTYLVRSDVIASLAYADGTARHEYVIFSDSARKAQIPQYIDNRQVYGYIAFGEGAAGYVSGGIDMAGRLLDSGHIKD
jgi:glycosyltransferase involved in cell wall biosynthesis